MILLPSLVNDLRNYFLTCPLLKENSALNVDFLSVDGIEYSIDTVPTETTIERYVDGSRLCQHNFVFASRENYSADSLQNIENVAFYEKLEKWINQNNLKRNLPKLLDGTAQKIEVTTAGYLFDENMTTARYQIQCRLTYIQEVENG